MQLYRKVQAVERVFRALSRDVAAFQKAAGVSCIRGCGACCTPDRIEASTLELLPLAYHLHRQNCAVELLESLSSRDAGKTCVFLDPAEDAAAPGRCTVYADRGLICRLFGFSGIVDRNGRTHYAACRVIKEHDKDRFLAVEDAVGEGLISIPVGPDYRMVLNAVDPSLMAYHPINVAIRKAVEAVLGYYSYRRGR
ncbi:MAG: YkgJ family cysteine cluster protein [Proteobacteria bacterium]|jgi:Fe-S-cluster containining protein|nr:YkgJ family cysteine cluster protein [Pseudomonadota bacterium]